MENSNGSKPTAAKGNAASFPLEVHNGPTATVPAWRAELSARVRQMKARRSMEAELEAALRDHRANAPPPVEVEEEMAMRTSGSFGDPTEAAVDAVETVTILEPELLPAEGDTGHDDRDIDNPLVRAALKRVRRASETPRTPTGFPPRRTEPLAKDEPAPIPVATPALTVEQVDIADIASELDAALEDFDFSDHSPSFEPVAPVIPKPIVLEEIRTPGSIVHRERPELQERVVAGLIDVIVVLLSCFPLWGIVALTDVNLASAGVQAIIACATLLIAGMYLFGTVAASGQTFGMMYAGLRVVSIYSDHEMNLVQALVRTLGHLPAALPLGGGFVWAAFDKNQRGLHEYMSGTQVVREWRVEL
jgi:uncharacterized RDD family membrane protein YckC